MLLRNVAGLHGGVGENCFAVLANVLPDFTTEEALAVGRECGERQNVLSGLHMRLPSRGGSKYLDTVITRI